MNGAFAPVGLFPLAFIALAVLFLLWNGKSPKSCAWTGYLFGLGFYGIGTSWLYISLHEFGLAPVVLAAALTFLLVSAMSAFVALCGYAQAKFGTSAIWKFLVLVPALWVITEWIRSWILTGFPWMYVGYSQTESWLAGWAPYFGVLGVSFAVCAVAGALVICILHRRQLGIPATAVAALILLAGFVGERINWVTSENSPITVAILQGNASVHDKWDSLQARKYLERYVSLGQRLRDRDLIIWPELAVAYTDKELEEINLWKILINSPPDFLIGVLEQQKTDSGPEYYNSVFGLSNRVQKYRKRHLVPLGEYLPFRSLLSWLEQYIDIPTSDFTPYREPQRPLLIAGELAGVTICFEDAFTSEMLDMLPEATYLVNISEDAWFGKYLSPHQRIQMSQMRAIEMARPVLRAANQGISAAIDHEGNVIDMLAQVEGHVLKTAIVPTTGATPFVRFGNASIVLVCFLLIIASTAARRLRPSTE